MAPGAAGRVPRHDGPTVVGQGRDGRGLSAETGLEGRPLGERGAGGGTTRRSRPRLRGRCRPGRPPRAPRRVGLPRRRRSWPLPPARRWRRRTPPCVGPRRGGRRRASPRGCGRSSHRRRRRGSRWVARLSPIGTSVRPRSSTTGRSCHTPTTGPHPAATIVDPSADSATVWAFVSSASGTCRRASGYHASSDRPTLTRMQVSSSTHGPAQARSLAGDGDDSTERPVARSQTATRAPPTAT